MKILNLKNLFREEGYIYYRRNFSGTADVEIPGQTLETDVDFCIETDPLGKKTVDIQFKKPVNFNYPILPIKKALKDYILKQDSEGKLP